MTDIPLIESLLVEVRLALDQLLLDENAVTPEAFAAEGRVRLEQSEVVMRLEALRPEIDRHLARR
jgi:hypothetical protein